MTKRKTPVKPEVKAEDASSVKKDDKKPAPRTPAEQEAFEARARARAAEADH